ncbi:fatty acyl-AMP ligase [Dolichospermum circinale CS-1225]|uniref:fatty acyl-AMP ligase n=1 Tax=Dolichospermum circinale TaxID=109265 RepID=UPI002330C3AF|nr:fatty acyl-AMP ligase [Dolichospermum circinale]MDB9468877.1 fatty acyl-AMP ligase [Dolichospermum circinale CS-539/09]MDB9469941.1 fatty acyl-AMP ligase [Dolichospermum circinale CS-539]MDB9522870.1 fatty acyl-AMP ligase [Dolichospermum circinale CS-1225]
MINLISILNQRANQTPNQLAYIFLKNRENQAQNITYQQLSQNSKNIAIKLQSLIPEGSRALLLYPQGLEFINAFLGCLYAGIIAVPAYPPKRNQKMSRLAAIIKDAEPQIILTTSSILESIKEKLTDIVDSSAVQWLATDNLNNEEELSYIFPNISNDSLAFLQYTSGSTGTPKGVMISHGNIVHNSASIQKAFELTKKSVSVTWLPSFHDMGLIDGIIQPLYTGFLGVILPPESFLQRPILWLQAITKYRATHSGGPNLGYELCVEKISLEEQKNLDLSSWVSAYSGAEPIRRRTLENFITKFQSSGFQSQYFYPCYGMAEATLMITGGNIEDEPVYLNVQSELLENKIVLKADVERDNYQQMVGCGHTWLDTEIRIVDPETCTQCADNQVGEIWVSGSSIAQGYWHQPEKTIETFQAKLVDMGERNFLRTGDLGFIQNGELFITGRMKDVIIIWGRNHYPQDIEYSVQQSHKALSLDCGAAFTVEVNHQEKLVIVQEVERTYLRKLAVDEIVSAIRETVALNHGLQVYAILLIKPASIPKTSSGKIQRHACRHAFLTKTLVIVGQWQQNQL